MCSSDLQRDVQPAAVGKFYRGLDPVIVVGEICPLGDAQLIQQYFPAKIQRQGSTRVAVDAPALIGVLAVGAVFKNAVDGVAGGKHQMCIRDRYYPGLAILVFLALDFLVLAVLATLCAAVLPLQLPAPDSLLRRAGRLLAVAPARCVLAGVLMLAGIGGMILLFPVSIFWAVLFGFWLPGLAAMQTLFPVLRQEYGVEVRSIPRPTAPDKPLTTQEQKKRSRANWWYYNWGIVAVAAMVIVGVAYVAHGLLTTVDPDYTVAVVTAEALPDEAVQRLQTALADYAEDANGDGAVIVQVNNYTWSADAALTDMNGQMAGATQMNTDLANGESKIWILDDPEGFEQAYGALSEKLGADWQAKLIPWSSQPALSGLELGSYNTADDGSQTVDIQSRFAGYSVAVFDASDALWQALNS